MTKFENEINKGKMSTRVIKSIIFDLNNNTTFNARQQDIEDRYNRYLKKIEDEKEKARQKEEAKRVYRAERADWIKQYGSNYLKDCLELDVSANKQYIIERANLEFSDFCVDYDNDADWESRVSPSVEGLALLKELRAKYPDLDSQIVWLTRPCYNDYDHDGYPCEAVVIRNYYGYDLIRKI